ncbi:hypothetical protein [Microbulbifer discodermiae]|uniref:hypothetical protein n=1 Tax=Microbulbifer sp. 2201CG32-9 TaxID=3232309 RepID=UPI00345BCEE3
MKKTDWEKMKSFKQAEIDLLSESKLSVESKCIPEHEEFLEWFSGRHNNPLVIDIKKSLHWFIEYMGHDSWLDRRRKLIDYFRRQENNQYENSENHDLENEKARLAFHEDWIAWYLYLAESLADRPAADEPGQSIRIYPFFATIGKFSKELKKVRGIDAKLHDLLKKRINQPDSVLFELVVAICYLKNGWKVEFIPEKAETKTPDLHVARGDQDYFVECKRLSKTTQYAKEENAEWRKRWREVVPLLNKYPHSVFLDVKFKVEVAKTDVKIVAEAFDNMASCGAVKSGDCYENEHVIICAKHINMGRVHSHLNKWLVRYPSAQLHSLVDDNYEPQGSYTFVGTVKLVTISPDNESVVNRFVDEIGKISCAKWECVAAESIDKKAKVVKNLLVKAVNQAPKNRSTIVHIGYETLHGPHIEYLRDAKIHALISSFCFNDKDIPSIFCHSFQPRLLEGEDWDFAETTKAYGFSEDPHNLLHDNLLMDREESIRVNGTHWSQDIEEYLNR